MTGTFQSVVNNTTECNAVPSVMLFFLGFLAVLRLSAFSRCYKTELVFYENLFLLLKRDSVMQVGIISFHLSDGMLRISNLVNRSRKLLRGF